MDRVTRRRLIGSDAAIGVITTASFAFGLALFALLGSGGSGSFDAVLFGSILGVRSADMWAMAIVTLFAGLVVFFRYRALLFSTFDPEVADVSGVKTARVDALLMLVLAASILVSMRVVGVTLIAAACGLVGMNLSYHLDAQSGTTIVLVGALLFALVFAFTGPRAPRRTVGFDAH
ncbi:MAG: metal ABC transporter permease [Egibacteraceae bacterium]